MTLLTDKGDKAVSIDSLSFSMYQRFTDTTVLPTADNLTHHVATLMAESFEVLGKMFNISEAGLTGCAEEFSSVQKGIRRGEINTPEDAKIVQAIKDNPERLEAIVNEVGDVLWACAQICSILGVPLAAAAHANHTKLTRRKKNGTIEGNGDKR